MAAWDEEYRPIRMRSLSVRDLHEDDGHLVYLCSPLEQAVLQRLHQDLIWTLPGPDLAPHLYAKGLITHYEYEQFRAKTTLTEKNEHLLMSLSRRPAGVLESLLNCLDDSGNIPGVEAIAKSLREKLDVKQFSQLGSVDPLPAEAQKIQASPIVNMVPTVVFEYLRDENKKLKKENEALRTESQMSRNRATMLEVKFKRFKKRVRRRTGELKEAVESSDDEDTDNESRRHHSRQVTEAVRQPLQETSNGSGFNAASDLAYDSQEMRRHAMPPSHFAAQQSVNDAGHQEMRRHTMPPLHFAAQQSANDAGHQEMRHHVMPPSHFAVQQSADDKPDIGKPEVFSPSNTSCTPNPSLPSQNGDSEKRGGVVQRCINYFSRDTQTTSKSSTENSVGQLQNAGTSSSRRNIAGSSRRATTPQGKAEASKLKNKPGGNRRNDTSVDKPSIESASEIAKPKSGAKPQPPPQNKTGGKAASSSGRIRSRYQVKYDQLHHPQ